MIKEGFIVCDNNTKKRIIKETKEFKNYIFISLLDLESKLFANIDKTSVFALMNKYDLSYELALELLDYIKYIDNTTYNNVKLDSLVSMRNYLITEGLLAVDNLFINRLKQYPITFINPIRNKRFYKIVNEISKYTNIYYFDNDNEDHTSSIQRRKASKSSRFHPS